MAKFNKKPNNIEISELKDNELIAILKINIPCTLVFEKSGTIISYIILNRRLERSGKNLIEISTLLENNSIIGYDELFELISDNMKTGILSVQVDNSVFQEKESLLLMLSDLKTEIIQSCIYIDYDPKKHIYIIINKKSKEGLSDKLYYFEDNDSILALTDNGPILIYGKCQSVEDLICN
jgi:hypothetical protein